MAECQEVPDEKNKAMEQVKRTIMKGRALDQMLKDRSSCVSGFFHISDAFGMTRSPLRGRLYRKCRVEEVRHSLLQGHFKNVPVE